MPTGYTNTLDETKKSTKDWIIEDLVRQFGICIMLRDESANMSTDEILKKLQEESNYHAEKLKESETLFSKYSTMNNKSWKNLMATENKEISDYNQQSKIKAATMKELHARAEKDLRVVILKTTDTVTQNICNFGLQQLKLTESECTPYITELHTNLESFKHNKIQQVLRDIQYHRKEMKEEIERNKSRIDCFIKLRDEVTRILISSKEE